MSALLKVTGLSKRFESQSGPFWKRQRHIVRAVDGVSFELGEHETLGIVGESGCGKSTTGALLVRLLDQSSGSIEYRGTDITKLPESALGETRRRIQMVFQDPYASLDPMMTLGEAVAEPWEIHGTYPRSERKREAERLLLSMGLEESYARRYPHELSGGQRQRVAIARALALDPEILIADEPTSALDVSVKAQIINLLRELRDRKGLSMIFISHDLGLVRFVSDRILVMYLGRMMEEGPTREVFSRPAHPYTRALIDSVPIPDPARRRARAPLRGEASLKDATAAGCPFLPRCVRRGKGCDETKPSLAEMTPGRLVACLYPDTTGGLK